MPPILSEEVIRMIKDLIFQLSGFQDGTEIFKHTEKYFRTELRKADSLYFLSKKDVDENINSMSEKFMFHGFFAQAEALKIAYNKSVPKDLTKSDLMTRLNVIKFLLCMSQSPTSNFLGHPEEYTNILVEEENEIDWKEYLLEGIEKWAPDFDESSEYSESSSTYGDGVDNKDVLNKVVPTLQLILENPDVDEILDLRANREELLATIQHTWYNENHIHFKQESKWTDANIGVLWDDYLKEQVKGLIPFASASFLSEYKVIREVLWQLWGPHTSSVFEFDANILKPKSNISISSVRAVAFESFLKEFIPYIEVLDFFREFSASLKQNDPTIPIPATYASYCSSLDDILTPIYKQLSELEESVRMQEKTFTLLKLAEQLKTVFEPIITLKKIHEEVVINFKKNTPLQCSTNLLARLHNSLQYSSDKMEQDLRLTLFLESLYHYFKLMDAWLMKDDLADYTKEFPIININYTRNSSNSKETHRNIISPEAESAQLNFQLQTNISDFCKNNSVIKIINDQVLQIGRNIHLLRLLGKYNLINDYEETIHEEFVRKSLEYLCTFYNVTLNYTTNVNQTNGDKLKYKYPVVCIDDCKKPTEMDNLENLVDADDGLLMKAFSEYFVGTAESQTVENTSLYAKISTITTNLFPVQNVFENILNSILKERFTVSGLMVKNLLIDQYKLDRQFEFLRHMFLFSNDLIFPFYRRFFEKMNSHNKNWGNEVWLTSHLQDIIMDLYQDFYENCTVQMKEYWRTCSDSLDACNVIYLHHEIQWPLNIIIKSKQMAMYKEIFQFILRVKWALYTVNHLTFTEIEPKKKSFTKNWHKSFKLVIMKLKFLKFCLINIINNIQHYIFGFVFNKYLMKFELDFEKSNDLRSIMLAHEEYILSIHRMAMDVRDCGTEKQGFTTLLNCVKMLNLMWNDVGNATTDKLNDCYEMYKNSYKIINPLINPVTYLVNNW